MNEGGIHLFEPGRASFSMSLIRGGQNGVAVNLTTVTSQKDKPETAGLHVDDGFAAEGNAGQNAEIMIETIVPALRKKIRRTFAHIGTDVIVWARDSFSDPDGPSPGFIAFQKRVRDGCTTILCMVMKRKYSDFPLSTPTVLFIPEGQEPATDEHPWIMTPPAEWTSLEYLMARLYSVQVRGKFPSLATALDHAEVFFREPLEPENYGKIKRVFGIG